MSECNHTYFGAGCIHCGKSQAERAHDALDKLEEAIAAIEKLMTARGKLMRCRLPIEYAEVNQEINLAELEVQGVINRHRIAAKAGGPEQ